VGRDEPLVVELHPEDRQQLEMTDEELHALLPTALQRRAEEQNPDDELSGEAGRDVTWDAPVRVYQTHFIG
jgi:hypothetical protein